MLIVWFSVFENSSDDDNESGSDIEHNDDEIYIMSRGALNEKRQGTPGSGQSLYKGKKIGTNVDSVPNYFGSESVTRRLSSPPSRGSKF